MRDDERETRSDDGFEGCCEQQKGKAMEGDEGVKQSENDRNGVWQAPPREPRGLYYGDGLYETLRYDERCGGYVMARAHRRRLAAGAQRLGLRLPTPIFSPFTPPTPKAAVRWTFWRQGAAPYFSPETHVQMCVESRPVVGEREPVRLRTADVRLAPTVFSPFKTLNALPYVLAARQSHPDVALMLSTTKSRQFPGRTLVAAAAGYNIFFLKAGTWITPPLATGCIGGVMRRFFLRWAETGGWQALVAPVTAGNWQDFDGAVLTNAVVFFRPVLSIDDYEFPPVDPRIWAKAERLLIAGGFLAHDERRYG
jgi:branched-subunit amino acid aminotransferase/4-amino-4-deoxychorismate lyase